MKNTRTNSNCQYQSTAAVAGPSKRSKPPAPDERGFALPLFRQAGRAGINRLHFLRGSGVLNGRLITQIGRLIHQLEAEGYVFLHQKRSDSKFIYYVLVAEPLEAGHAAARKPVAAARGWKAERFVYGKQESVPPAQRFLSLFDGMTATNSSSRFISSETGKVNW